MGIFSPVEKGIISKRPASTLKEIFEPIIKKDLKSHYIDDSIKSFKNLEVTKFKDSFSDFIKKGNTEPKFISKLIIKEDIKSLNKIQSNLFNNFIPKPYNTKLSSVLYGFDSSPHELIASLPDEIKGKTDISELSMHAKRVLLRVVAKVNTNLFDHAYTNLPILPQNAKQYCSLMRQLAKAVSIDVLPVSEKAIHGYYSAMQRLEHLLPETDISKLNIQLQMPRHIFAERAKCAIEALPKKEQQKVFDYFGFEIKDGKMTGYPVHDPQKQIEDGMFGMTRKTIDGLRGLVDKFTTDNRIILPPEQKPLEDALNDVVKVFPEFLTTIGKAQHGTHQYTLDLHLLKVLQETMRNPEYKNLSQEDKKVLNMVALLHDVAKTEGEVDKAHPFESALDISYIVQKMNLPIEQQERIVNMIRNHHWLEKLSTASDFDNKALQEIAFEFRKPNDIKMAKIFAESDLKGVSDSFFEGHKGVLSSDKLRQVEKYHSQMYQSGVYFPQSRIPKASQIKLAPITLGHGESATQNTVIRLSEHQDLKALGFSDSQLQTFVHTFSGNDHAVTTLNELSKEANDGVLSTSFIDRNNFGTYWGNSAGVLLDVEPTNIIRASSSNMGSGYKKDLASQIRLIFENKIGWDEKSETITHYREDFAKKLQQALGINKEEYAKLYETLAQAKDLESIPDKKVRKAVQEVVQGYLRNNGSHNEITVLAPKIKGVFVKEKDSQEIPYAIRKFAQENDLPIIIF